MSSARSVAKELVRVAMLEQVPDPLTYYRLQSLLYYAQAWSLVLRNSELFPEEIVCLVEGPTVPEIPNERGTVTGWKVIRPDAFSQEPGLDDEDETVFLSHLWAAYRYFSPSGLFSSIQGEPPYFKAKQEGEKGGKGPTNPRAATARSRSHMVAVFTTVVFAIVTSSRVTAFQAPSTLNRCRPDAALTKTRASDHRQHRNVPNTKWAASTKYTCRFPATAASSRGRNWVSRYSF
jgi:uncharacterized phage-associated protein